MSFNFDGFNDAVQGGDVTITIPASHPLIELANALPWEMLLTIILPYPSGELGNDQIFEPFFKNYLFLEYWLI